MKSPQEIVDQLMLANDEYSQWLGIEILHLEAGRCEANMKVRKEMLNGFHIAHGGITYALADSVFAFAINSFGYQAVSVESSISHTKKVVVGDILTAKSKLLNKTSKFGIYHVEVINQANECVALFKGTAYITSKMW